jgi:HEAT repeats/PBS lyase HEAT-like repeat
MPGDNTSERLRSATLARLGLEKNALPPGIETQMDQLISTLGNPDTATRTAAIRMIAKLEGQAVVEPLVNALHDESDIVRAASARALGTLEERTPVEPLVSALHDSSWRVRAAAAQALGKSGERAPTEELAALVNDEDESVCIAAVQALGEMGERVPMEPLVLALYDQSWSVREAAVLTLEKIGGREALTLLEEALQDKDAVVRETAQRVLQRKAAEQERLPVSTSQPALIEPIPFRPQPRWRPTRPQLSRRFWGAVAAIAVAACIVLASFAIVPRFFSQPPLALQGFGGASFASSATNILSQHDGSIGVNDELLFDLYSLQAPASGKSYYGWLLANASDPAAAIPLGKLPFHQGKISYLYKNPTHQNLLLTSSYFLITEEDTNSRPLTPAQDRTQWRYSAEISQIPNPSDTAHHNSLFDHIQYLLAKDPTLESMGLRGGVGFWLTRNAGKVGENAHSTQEYWKNHDAQQVRSQVIGMLDYLDGVSYVHKDLPPGTSLQVPQTEAPIGLLVTDPQGLLAHTKLYLNAIAQSPQASADQKAQATRLVTEVNKINAQCEMVHQDARTLMQMTDAQLLQPSSLVLLNDMATHADLAFTGNAKINMEGALKVFNDIQSLASFDVEAYRR